MLRPQSLACRWHGTLPASLPGLPSGHLAAGLTSWNTCPMRAMVLAAGLGTRLRPLTYELTKPMVPVLDRPVMEHILDLIDAHGFGPVIANLHYFPETIRDYFGDRLEYRLEEELMGTAGGVRGCREFFGELPSW